MNPDWARTNTRTGRSSFGGTLTNVDEPARRSATAARQRAPRVFDVLLLILVAGRLALWLVGLVSRTLIKVAADDDTENVSAIEQRANTIADVFKGVGKIAIYVVGTLVAFDVVGIDTGPLLGSVAILGLALSFGSQNLVRDLVNGFFILVENQYAVGDWVKIGSHEGTVEQINIRSTRLRSSQGVLQIIPNGTIATVENMTRDWSRFRCHVGVGYDTDIDLAERICNEVGAAMYADPELQDKRMEAPTFIGVTDLGRGDTRSGQDPARLAVGPGAGDEPTPEEGVRRRRHRDPLPATSGMAPQHAQRIVRVVDRVLTAILTPIDDVTVGTS